MRILDHLIRTIRSAANHNAEAQAAPACILWPDPNRHWQAALPPLQTFDCPGPSTACTA